MRATPIVAPLAALLAFLPAACQKAQVSAVATPVALPTKRAPAEAPVPVADTPAHFTVELRRGQQFLQSFAPNMVFLLEPYAANDSGWTIRIVPGSDPQALAMDCIGAISEPLHGDTNLAIEPPEDAAQERVKWKPREFDFVPDAANCKQAWDLMNLVYYASKLTDEQRAEAGEKLGKIPTAHGKLAIIDSRLSPRPNTGDPPVIEWLKFEVELSLPPSAQASNGRGPANSESGGRGIRGVDLADFLNKHYDDVNPQLADLQTDCGEGQKPIQSIAPFQYGDLDGDGQEEAAFMAFTCLSGTGGVDFLGVLKLLSDGKIISLPIQDAPKPFKGRDPYQGLRGRVRLEIEDGKLLEIFPTYPNERACNNCSTGERKFVYRWDGHRFVVDDIMDGPPES